MGRQHTEDTQERRRFPRFPVTNPVICTRHGKRISMRSLDMSLGGLKLEANFDLGVGESIDFIILARGTEIHCKGKVIGIEDFGHKVHARLHLNPSSESERRKLAEYLHTLYWGRFQKWVIGGIIIALASISSLLIYTYFF